MRQGRRSRTPAKMAGIDRRCWSRCAPAICARLTEIPYARIGLPTTQTISGLAGVIRFAACRACVIWNTP